MFLTRESAATEPAWGITELLQADTSGHCPTPGYRCVPRTVQHTLPWAIWPSRDAWMPICRCSVVKAMLDLQHLGWVSGCWTFKGDDSWKQLERFSRRSIACCRLLDASRNCYVWAYSRRYCKCLWLAACPCCGGDPIRRSPNEVFVTCFP